MPKGKLPIYGYGYTHCALNDCSEIEFLLRHRKSKLPPPTEVEINSWKLQINEIVSVYINASIASLNQSIYTVPTCTEQKKKIRKVMAASRQLINAIEQKRYIEKRAKKLLELLSLKTLGLHVKNSIHRTSIFYKDGKRIGDIFHLEKSLEEFPITPLDDISTVTLELLAKIRLPMHSRASSTANPLWRELIPPLAIIWTEATGRTAQPNNMEGKFLFKDWIQLIMITAADSLNSCTKDEKRAPIISAKYLTPSENAISLLAA